MDAINASFASNDPHYRQPRVGDTDDEEEEEEEYEGEGSEGGEGGEHVVNDAVEKDPNEEFWDEFFDSLIITVPFTFLYLLLDMSVLFPSPSPPPHHPVASTRPSRNPQLFSSLHPALCTCNTSTDRPSPNSLPT